MKSLAIQALVLAGTVSLAFSKFSWGACPSPKDPSAFTLLSKADYIDFTGGDITDSWTYEHRVLAMDQGFIKA